MWYAWQSRLVCIQVDPDGLSADFTESPLIQENGNPMPSTGYVSLTMLEDGSLLFATEVGSSKPFVSEVFHIDNPQCDGSISYAKFLGVMPDDIGIEALYTDAIDRIYVMDTGVQYSSTSGNRLLRFTGNVLTGDFSYEVISGPSQPVPDIDGLGPGIDKTTGWVVDNPGFAIDSYHLYHVDYETGTFSFIATTAAPYATHAINGSHFTDGNSRLYALSGIPQAGHTSSSLYEIDPDTGATLRTLGSGPSGMGLTGGLAPGPGDEPDEKEPPVADAGLDRIVVEGDAVTFNGSMSHDPNGSIQIYEWDFDSKDGLWWNIGAVPDATGSTPTHTYGDDGVFVAILRVTDNDNLSAIDSCNITVQNVDPIVTIESISMNVEIGLRVAGRKYNDVGMTLNEDNAPIGYLSIERLPGSPDDQMAWIPVSINCSSSYNATVTYSPKDPPNVGANPVWIYIKSQNGSITKIHHTFNVQQSKKRDSEHWNHIEPWEVDLSSHFIGLPIEITSHITDPGSDDEILTYSYGSQIINVTYLNNPTNPDPYPSPEVNPVDIMDIITLVYEGPGTVMLMVEDDDGGLEIETLDVG